MSAIKLGLSALNGPVSQLPPRRFAAINPTTTVEEALSEAIALTLSVSSILGALTTSMKSTRACMPWRLLQRWLATWLTPRSTPCVRRPSAAPIC